MEWKLRAYTRLLNDPMLNIWLNIKSNSSRKKLKIWECHATAYAFLRVWYKFEVIQFSRFVGFIFRLKSVPEFNMNVYITHKVNMT